MAKNNKNNTDIDSSFIDQSAERGLDLTKNLEDMSYTYTKILEGNMDSFEELRQSLLKGDIVLDQFFRKITELVKQLNTLDVGIQGTTKSVATYNQLEESLKSHLIKNNMPLDEKVLERIIKTYANVTSQAVIDSNLKANRGDKIGVTFGKAGDENEVVKEIVQEYSKNTGIALDSAIGKLETFLGGLQDENKKSRKTFADYIIEGLANNKFIGGAAKDSLKLLGLIGGSWMANHFGKLGQFLGAAFYSAIDSLSGILTSAVISGIVQGFAQVIGGKLLEKIVEIIGKGSFLRSAVMNPVTIGSVVGGGAAIMAGIDSLEGGRTGNGAALIGGGAATGIGGVMLGTGIAASKAASAGIMAARSTAMLGSLASFLNPIGATLLAIGATVAVIVGLWKLFGEDISKGVKRLVGIKDKEDKDKDSVKNWLGKVDKKEGSLSGNVVNVNSSGMYVGNPGGVTGGRGNGERSGVKDSRGVVTYGKLKVNPDGSFANITKLSKEEVSRGIELYSKADPERFNNLYELVGEDIASLGSFVTNAAIYKNGRAVKALTYKGATNDVLEMRKRLRAAGMPESKVREFKIQSGIATGSNAYHNVFDKYGNVIPLSHGDPYGRTVDFGGGQSWSTADYNRYGGTISSFLGAHGRGYYFHGDDKSSMTGPHIHSKGSGTLPSGASQNLDIFGKRAKAETASILPKEPEKKEEKVAATPTVETPKNEQVLQPAQSTTQAPTVNQVLASPVITTDITGNTDYARFQRELNIFTFMGGNQDRI